MFNLHVSKVALSVQDNADTLDILSKNTIFYILVILGFFIYKVCMNMLLQCVVYAFRNLCNLNVSIAKQATVTFSTDLYISVAVKE